MKKEFIGFYNPEDEEINNAWNNGMFSFDANALLNLYRYTEVTRKDFIGALKTIKGKIFISHQAGYEYHSNRISVIEGLNGSYLALEEILKNNFDKCLKDQINQFKRHPSIIIDNLFKLHQEFMDKVSKELGSQKKNHPDFETKDDILRELTYLFDNHIGKEMSKEELKKIYSEGKERYADSVPPGYKDFANKQKKGERHIYGDLIIWKELINYSKKEKKPLIFVTDDRKEDWWTIENGKTIRPREELIKEFYDLTGIRILIYNADNFLHYAKEKKLVPQLKDNTIKEVKDIRVSDENNNVKIADFVAGTIAKNAKFHSLSDLVAAIGTPPYGGSIADALTAARGVQYGRLSGALAAAIGTLPYSGSLADALTATRNGQYSALAAAIGTPPYSSSIVDALATARSAPLLNSLNEELSAENNESKTTIEVNKDSGTKDNKQK